MNQKPQTVPSHIAIIMDGNRRWATERNLHVLEGHRRVVDHVLEPLIEHASILGVKYLTFWAWSTENWKRESTEVKGIMNLLRYGFATFGDRMHKNGIRILVIGNTAEFDHDIQELLTRYIEKTKNNTKITVTFALNYGGRDEIIRAANKALLQQLTADSFESFLDTAGTPDPDMIVRTGGEKRLSGFLLWQSQYSELFFVDWYMPEFNPNNLETLISEFTMRQRRFGA